MTKDLQTLIATKRHEIRDLLLAEASLDDRAAEIEFDRGADVQGSTASWQFDVGAKADFIMLLTAQDLPAAPFELRPGRTVVDSAKYFHSLQADVRIGADGPRARLGTLQDELQHLCNILLASVNSII